MKKKLISCVLLLVAFAMVGSVATHAKVKKKTAQVTIKYKWRDVKTNSYKTATLKVVKVKIGSRFSVPATKFPNKSWNNRPSIAPFKVTKNISKTVKYKIIPRDMKLNLRIRYYDLEKKKQVVENFKSFNVKEESTFKWDAKSFPPKKQNTRQKISKFTVRKNQTITVQYLPPLVNDSIPVEWREKVALQFPPALTFTNKMMKKDTTGAPWGQCTWGAKNFTRVSYGIKYGAMGNGGDVARNLINHKWLETKKPIAGSIVSYKEGSALGHPWLPKIYTYGYYGHVAMVIAVDTTKNSYLIAETNYAGNAAINYRESTFIPKGQVFAYPEKLLSLQDKWNKQNLGIKDL